MLDEDKTSDRGRGDHLLCGHMNSRILVPRDVVPKGGHKYMQMLRSRCLLGQCTRRTGNLDVVVAVACTNC